MLARAYRVNGQVQGVGFRWWTRSQAQRLGLSGSVRNAEDGSVEIQARGPDAAVADFERLLRSGPPGAEVTAVETMPAPPIQADGFDITR